MAKGVFVTVDKNRGYASEGSSIPLAIKRALEQHERAAREAKKRGDVVPESLKKIAGKRGLSIYVELK